MADCGFDEALKAQLLKFEVSIKAEYKHAVHRLETKVHTLEVENTRLQRSIKRWSRSHQAVGPHTPPETDQIVSITSDSPPPLLKFRSETCCSSAEFGNNRRSNRSLPSDGVKSLNVLPGQPASPASQTVLDHPCPKHMKQTTRDSLTPSPDVTPRQTKRVTIGSITSSANDSMDLGKKDSHDELSQYIKAPSESGSDVSEHFLEFHLLEAWSKANTKKYWRQNTRNPSAGARATADSIGGTEHRWHLEQKLHYFVVQPSSTKRLVWELSALLLILIDIVVIPLQFLNPPVNAFMLIATWAARIFWTMDIPFSFFTGYNSHSEEDLIETRPSKVAMKYICSQFPFDCIIVACDWAQFAMVATGNDVKVSRVITMMRVVRVFRVLSLKKTRNIRDFIVEHIRSEVAMIGTYVFGIVLGLLLLIHIIACVWQGIQSIGRSEDYRYTSDDTFVREYMLSFHVALALFVGEHIELPHTLLERFFTITVLIFAFVVTASLVGSLTTAMTRLQIIASQRSAQFAALSRYLTDCKVSAKLAVKVQRNAHHGFRKMKRRTKESSVELMALISEPLRAEIHYEVYIPILTQHPFFYLYNKVNLSGMRQICHTVVTEISISRGDALFAEFDVPVVPRTFFVMGGSLRYTRSCDETMKVTKTHWISEPALWTTWAHRGTLVANSECQFMAIDAHRFANITSSFPTCHATSYAIAFVEKLNQVKDSGLLTDIAEDNQNTRRLVLKTFQEIDSNLTIGLDWVNKGRRSVPEFDICWPPPKGSQVRSSSQSELSARPWSAFTSLRSSNWRPLSSIRSSNWGLSWL